jgi:hypothetical protein
MTRACMVTPGLIALVVNSPYLATVLELVTGLEPIAFRLQVGCSADMSFTSSCVVASTVIKISTLRE